MIGAGAVAAAGIVLALLFRPDLERDEPARPIQQEETASSQTAGASEGAITATTEPYRAPDRDAVRLAYARAAEIYQTQGASGLARFGQQCFRSLEARSTYRDLDFCLAFDAYGAAIAQRVSGGQPPGPESYFGQTEGRHMRVAEAVMAGEGDASARLIDIRRLAIEVARETGPVAPARATASATAPAASSSTPAPPTTHARAPAAATPPPSPRTTPPPETVPASRETPPRRVEAPPMPTAAEVAAARPAGRGPSFNCRYARMRSERLVCADGSLAALDRRLNAAFEDAIAAGADRRELRAEQDQWLAYREAAAPDPDAVADAYRRRISELNGMR